MLEIVPGARVLVIGAHTDDVELGAGGLMSSLLHSHVEVSVAHLSDTGNIYGNSVGDGLRREAEGAFLALGGDKHKIYFGDFPTRHFTEHRQAILDFLVELKAKVGPHVVIGPSEFDSHQDHRVVAEEIRRAFRGSTILAYDLFWNLRMQDTTVVAQLDLEDAENKVRALAQYKSQSTRAYMDPEVIRSQLRIRGSARGFTFAESFSPVQVNLSLPRGSQKHA